MNEFDDTLVEIRNMVGMLEDSLPEKIKMADFSRNSRIPYLVFALRELLFHRVVALSKPALELYESGGYTPAIVLTRSSVESISLLYFLREKLRVFLVKHDEDDIDSFLQRTLFGSRFYEENKDSVFASINVLTFIDKVERDYPGFRDAYDCLSEYAHPNWSGVYGSFGQVNYEEFVLSLGQCDRSSIIGPGILMLNMSLKIFKHCYDEMFGSLCLMKEYYEVK